MQSRALRRQWDCREVHGRDREAGARAMAKKKDPKLEIETTDAVS